MLRCRRRACVRRLHDDPKPVPIRNAVAHADDDAESDAITDRHGKPESDTDRNAITHANDDAEPHAITDGHGEPEPDTDVIAQSISVADGKALSDRGA